MRVLCISPVFVPEMDSEAFCGGKMVMALLAAGVETEVIRDKRQYRNFRLDDSKLWNPLDTCIHTIEEPRERSLPLTAALALRYKSLVYVRRLEQVLRLAEELHGKRPFDLIYSRSLPYWGHIAGYWIAKAFSRPWIANVNDPWDFHLFPGAKQGEERWLHRKMSEWWMRRVLRRADLVTYPSRRLAAFTEKISSVPHSMEIIPHVGLSVPAASVSPTFLLVHAGKLGSNELQGRPTVKLLEALRRFLERVPTACDRFQLLLVGPEDIQTTVLSRNLGLAKYIHCTGRVNYETSLNYIASASVCLLLENSDLSEGIYLPSKVTDYIAAGKPVLALSPANGEIADLSVSGGILQVSAIDVEAMAQALQRLFDAFANNRLDEFRPSRTLQDRFNPSTIARRFIDLAVDSCARINKIPYVSRPVSIL
jgi:glycosyltransferase involved in cell wall biosynthesis